MWGTGRVVVEYLLYGLALCLMHVLGYRAARDRSCSIRPYLNGAKVGTRERMNCSRCDGKNGPVTNWFDGVAFLNKYAMLCAICYSDLVSEERELQKIEAARNRLLKMSKGWEKCD